MRSGEPYINGTRPRGGVVQCEMQGEPRGEVLP